jgi:hypothetical protein
VKKDYTISDCKVMKSAAGWYIGLEYWDEDLEAWLPWDRMSAYFGTKAEAKDFLQYYLETRDERRN